MTTYKRFKCRFCGAVLPAWYRVHPAPNYAMLLGYLSQAHPDQVARYLEQMRGTEDMCEVVAEAFEVVEEESADDRTRNAMGGAGATPRTGDRQPGGRA
jgi:hypothetical protein